MKSLTIIDINQYIYNKYHDYQPSPTPVFNLVLNSSTSQIQKRLQVYSQVFDIINTSSISTPSIITSDIIIFDIKPSNNKYI